MKHTRDDALREIMRRSEIIMERKERRTTRILASMFIVLSLGVVGSISAFSRSAAAVSQDSVMGSFLLRPETMGYVFIAFLAFGAGVILAVLGIRYRNRINRERMVLKKEKEGEKEDDEM
ncbi:MAG: hypothetical protein IIY88_01400 [Eubacterium sp.]|nr:hypothetical protein [Eubacterium sp.]